MGFFVGTVGATPGGGAGLYALLRDEKMSGTQGGTFTSGAWRTRDLNTKVVDEIGITLAANQFTLPAGTYRFSAACPAHDVYRQQGRLRNITDNKTILDGESSFTSAVDAILGASRLEGQFTIAAPKTFELQHQCQTTKPTQGFGIAVNFDVEVYAWIRLEKVA